MRKIDPRLQEKLTSGATTLCRCWLVTRADGVSLGFTDHDASALESSTGLSVDNSQAVGALSAVGLTDADIQSGKYDGASVWLWLVDWMEPELRVLLFRGFLGEIQRRDGAFEVELRGLSEALNKTVGRSYIGDCDRVLGDGKCGFDLTQPGFSAVAQVGSSSDRQRIVSSGIGGFDEGWFQHGGLNWLSGANKGSISRVKLDVLKSSDRIIEFWEETPQAIEVGDQFKVIAGCNRKSDTCRQKFNNLVNFRGFPQMPGEDWVAAYPASGQIHDGQSIKNG